MAKFDLFGHPLPDSSEPPIEWPTQLHYRRGSPQRLSGIAVWHDFPWEEAFNHELSQFPNGQRLANLLVADCPDEKTPALILHRGGDVRTNVIETETHYCLVVNIDDYLDNAKADAARTYFTLRLSGLTVLSEIDSDLIAQWAAGNPERMQQLARIAGSPTITTEAISEWAGDDPEKLEILAEIARSEYSSQELRRALEWASNVENTDDALTILNEMDPAALEHITTIAGVARLSDILSTWISHEGNGDEEFWQQYLQDNAFVLSQVFAFPIVLVKGKAFVGRKGIDNRGGNIIDYLCKTAQTDNALMVEIKTPTAQLLRQQPYRQGIFNAGNELIGGVLQLSNYKDSLLKECRQLLNKPNADVEDAIDPKCLLIIGNTKQLCSAEQRKSFELYRNGLKDVQVITFDELFEKVRLLIQLLIGQ